MNKFSTIRVYKKESGRVGSVRLTVLRPGNSDSGNVTGAVKTMLTLKESA